MQRERGTYGPLDRERHLVLGWGADRATDYVRDRAVSATLGPVLPAISLAGRAARATRRLRMASQLEMRDAADRPLSVVGQEFFHTVADRERAIAQLSTGFRALVSDLSTWQQANKEAPAATVSAQWFNADVIPTLEEWRDFVEQQDKSWWTKGATSWETYEGWWQRLRQLRSLARAHGISLESAEPLSLPKTIWQRGSQGKGGEATALLGVLKVGVISALAITGAVSFYAILRELRPRKEA